MFEEKGQGKRTDLLELREKMLKKGYTKADLIKDKRTFPCMVHYERNISNIMTVINSLKEKVPPVVHVYTGLAHTGKSIHKHRKVLQSTSFNRTILRQV